MSNASLTRWRMCVHDYYKNKGEPYKIPRKGTKDYEEIKKIYSKGENEQTTKKCVNCKSYKCRCKCPYDKPKK